MCRPCLSKPQPLQAEYSCTCCRSPFLSPYPLDEYGRCGLCRFGESNFDAAYSFGFYEEELRELIHLFKYSGITTLAGPLGKWLRQALPRDQRFDVIVPMPIHWRKRLRRGFNQAAALAAEISAGVGVPVRQPIRRIHQKAAQAGLTHAKRRANVAGAFRAKKGAGLAGKRVLLVDDVLTTGATARACAGALKAAGATSVTLLTVARVDRRMAAADHKSPHSLFPESTVSGSYQDAKSGSFA